MKIEIKHQGRIENGRIIQYNPELFAQQLAELEGKEFILTIKEKHRKPTYSQYNFYRGGILPSCYQSEMFFHLENKDKIHELYFAKKFLTHKELVVLQNEKYEVEITRSLADISDAEMRVFLEKVIAHCDELGIIILSPDEYYNKHYSI